MAVVPKPTNGKGKARAVDTQEDSVETGPRARQPTNKQQQINAKAATAQANKAARIAEAARVLAEKNRDPEERYAERREARDASVTLHTQPSNQRKKKINAAPPPGFHLSSSTRTHPTPTPNSPSHSQPRSRPNSAPVPPVRPDKSKPHPQRIHDSDDEPPAPSTSTTRRPKPSDYDFEEHEYEDEEHTSWAGRDLGFSRDDGGEDGGNGLEDDGAGGDGYDNLGDEERMEMEDDPQANDEPVRGGPSQPKSSRKRPAPDSPPHSPQAPTRRPRNSGDTDTGRPKAANYKQDIVTILSNANRLFRITLATTMGFPTTEAAIKAAYQVWKDACIGTQHEDLQNKPDTDQITIILSRECQMRGEVKTIARPLVRAYYHFMRRDSMIADNVKLYQTLIYRSSFVFENPVERKKMWCHPVLFDIIWEMWFCKKTRDGVRYSDDFGTIITPQTIALVFTVVRNCLDEWESGTWEQVDLAAEDYTDIYEALLSDLKLMGDAVLQAFGRQLWKDASKGKIFSEASAPVSSLTSEEKDNAIRELQEWTEAHQD